VIESGQDAKRIKEICQMSGISVRPVPMDLGKIESLLAREKDVAGVICVHCEAATGSLSPVDEIGKVVKRRHPSKRSVFCVT